MAGRDNATVEHFARTDAGRVLSAWAQARVLGARSGWYFDEEFGEWAIRARSCRVRIEVRNYYYDRGNWAAHLEQLDDENGAKLWIDLGIEYNDYWPRYYMDLTRAVDEIEAWLTKRGQMTVDPDVPGGL